MTKSSASPAAKPSDPTPEGPATVSTQASAPVVPVVIEPSAPDVMNAADLRIRVFTDMPRLDVTGMDKVIGAVTAALSLEHMGVPIEVALKQLKVAGVSVSLIRAGISAMKSASDKEALEASTSFNEKAGPDREVDPVTLSPANANAREKAEQAELRQKAVALQGRAAPLLTTLFARKDEGGITGWVKTFVRKVDDATLKTIPVPSAELPGWKTAPKLNEGDPQVGSLLDQLGLIESTYELIRDAKKTLIQLQNLNAKFTSEHVKGILEACMALAGEQIVQSTTVEGVADADAAAFVTKAQKIASVRATADKADAYLNSGSKK